MKKGLLLIIVCLAMVFTLVPAAALADTEITSVSVSGLSMPIAGEKFDFNVSVGSNYTVNEVVWEDTTASQAVTTGDLAVAGHKYRYDVELVPDEGYSFPYKAESNGSSIWQFYDGTAKINGTACITDRKVGPYALVMAITGYTNSGHLVISGFYTPAADKNITSVAVKDLDMPRANEKLDFTATVTGNYTVEAVSWEDVSSGGIKTPSDLAIAGHKYRYDIELAPDEGYLFPYAANSNGTSSWQFYSGSAKVNGNACIKDTAIGPYAMVMTSSDHPSAGHLIITGYYTAPVISIPIIIEQPESVNAKEGDTVTFSVTAFGADLHYQWWVADAGMPEKIGKDSSELILEKVTAAQYDGYSFWCVISNSGGSVASEQVKLNVTASPYVFPFTDVKTGDWFYNDVKIANQMGLIDGRTNTLFKPDDNMTYAEAIKLAACMNQYYTTGKITLTTGTPWYQTYVEYAKTHGIPWSFEDYNATITRTDYVYIFYYALPADNYKEINTISAVPDVSTSATHANEIYAFYKAGILTGNTDHSFLPNTNIKRSEVAAILTRMMDPSTRQKLTL